MTSIPTSPITPTVVNWELQWFNSIASDKGTTPIVLLHPWFGCPDMWQPVASRLQRPALAINWYGLGEVEQWQPWATPAGLMAALTQLLQRLDLHQVDVVGNSVGGIVAQLLAIHHPDLVRRLVLIGTGASLSNRPTEFGTLVSQWITYPDQRDELVAQLVDALTHQPLTADQRQLFTRRVRRANPDFMTEVLTQARQLDLRSQLHRIAAPTLVIRGEHDTARTTEHVAELLAGIPHARAVELTGCGHSPMVEEPDILAELIASHCAHG